ncbi:MAG: hypothetical protein NUV45_01350 [Tepidanaerobacteraceae bacterium]|jgi:hypothetical protein|nr:hypothetical protein [Tepidanaerobacteraceae bacterium]
MNVKKLLAVIIALSFMIMPFTMAYAAADAAGVMASPLAAISATQGADKAIASPQKVFVDGREVRVEAYNINGYNYFKLRDIARLLSGTKSQFSVDYDAGANTIIAKTGEAYQPVGGELSIGADKSAACASSNWVFKVNGLNVNASKYIIGGNNFFKLRDLGTAFGFAVAYDSSKNAAVITSGKISLVFNDSNYAVKTSDFEGKTIAYRAYENIVYVSNPVDADYEVMNIYIPEEYFGGKSIGNYNAETAPIFFPNMVGGYMPAKPGSPGVDNAGNPNAILMALSKGYVVAAPGARGRTLQGENGTFTGKAPACIVDLKAAVRYLRYNDEIMPGSAERIVSNGTSAGGALSALLGATGNNADYAPYLEEIGAANEPDDIFAASCYCPITNLDNADTAYEWLFNGINDYDFRGTKGTLTEDQIKVSNQLKAMFPAYLNSLGLKKADGTALTLDLNGDGTFKDYVKSFVIASAQKALDNGTDLSGLDWITINNGTVTDIDFEKYAVYATRMKPAPAFDALDLSSFENSLFGTAAVDNQHFTKFSQENSTKDGSIADAKIIKMMNPMNYIGTEGTTTAKYWRIRHGAVDRDTSLAIPVILATKLENEGFDVDFMLPWGQGHGGDYDLDELFDWIDRITKK